MNVYFSAPIRFIWNEVSYISQGLDNLVYTLCLGGRRAFTHTTTTGFLRAPSYPHKHPPSEILSAAVATLAVKSPLVPGDAVVMYAGFEGVLMTTLPSTMRILNHKRIP
jgi:hypothetical protein